MLTHSIKINITFTLFFVKILVPTVEKEEVFVKVYLV